jgi:hypothetical protein
MNTENKTPLVELSDALLDALRISVGFGLLTFQRIQVARREAEAAMKKRCPPPQP